jgi:hypothetical protein
MGSPDGTNFFTDIYGASTQGAARLGSISASDGSTFSPVLSAWSNGNVGIGISTAPGAKLHVVGEAIVTSTIWLNAAKTVGIFSGNGTPEGSITASPGSTYHDTGGTFYVKQTGTGSTGWVAK